MTMRYDAPFPSGGGEPARPRGPHGLRIGDVERDDAAADLGEHYAAGRLSLDELHERLDAVLAAKTFGHLTRIMTDLPRLSPGHLEWPAALGRPGHGPRDGRRAVGSAENWAFGKPEPLPAPTEIDRAGRFAALALLMLAMLLWLFTALLFARHGVPQQVAPTSGSSGWVTHTVPFLQSGQFSAKPLP
jgi:hypothetical protein